MRWTELCLKSEDFMKKKILFLFAGILCLAGVFFSCAADASGDSGNSDFVKGCVVYNV